MKKTTLHEFLGLKRSMFLSINRRIKYIPLVNLIYILLLWLDGSSFYAIFYNLK
jgi:hypothetical protein